jgi:FixJ family two-component response regulator
MSDLPLSAVVDDDAAIRDALQSLLRAVGLRAAVVASAADFWQADPRQATASLIVDVRLPRMSGLALPRQLATATGPTPIIFITAQGDAATRARALREGAGACLDNPFSEEVLLRAVEAALPSSSGGEGCHHGDMWPGHAPRGDGGGADVGR